MKFLKYLFIWFCILFLLGSVAGYVYIRMEGKRLFEKQLTKFFGQPAQIDEIRYLVPVGIRLTNLRIQNVLEVEDVRLHLRIPFLLSGYFIIAKLELERPVFHLVRYAKKKIDFGGVYLKKQEAQFYPEKEKTLGRVFHGIAIDLLSVNNGELMLIDMSVPEPVKYEFVGIRGKAMKAVYPLSDQQIRFDLQGVIQGAGSQKFLKQTSFVAGGWINWPGRSMDMTLNIHQASGIVAKMTLKGKDNMLQIQGLIETGNIDAASVAQGKEFQQEGLGGGMLAALQMTQSKLNLNINMQTEMDALSFGVVTFQGDWQLPQLKKEGPERLNPAGLFGILPSLSGSTPKK